MCFLFCGFLPYSLPLSTYSRSVPGFATIVLLRPLVPTVVVELDEFRGALVKHTHCTVPSYAQTHCLDGFNFLCEGIVSIKRELR